MIYLAKNIIFDQGDTSLNPVDTSFEDIFFCQ